MLLSDGDILRLLESGELVIENFHRENLTPNGYDLTIAHISIPSENTEIEIDKAIIPPMTWFLVGTEEILSLPDDLACDLWIKTSWARKGVISSFGKIDAGFRGNLTLSALNASHKKLEISIGQKFAQMNLIPLQTRANRGYGERSGNFQDQRRITIEPRKLI